MDLVSDEHCSRRIRRSDDLGGPRGARGRPGRIRGRGSQRTTRRDQREPEPEGNQGGAEGVSQGGTDARRRKCLQPEGLECRMAE